MKLYIINEPFSLQYTIRNTFSLLIVLSITACNSQESETKKYAPPMKNNSKNATAAYVSNKVKSNKKKKIYLTFDDGPNKGTANVLNIISNEEVPVSFFLVGEHASGSKLQYLVLEELKNCEYAGLYNHGYTHAWHNQFEKFYNNPNSVVYDFEKAEDSLQLNSCIIRCPGRNAWRTDCISITDLKNSANSIDSLSNSGYTVIGWDIEWHYDAKTLKTIESPETMVNEIDSALTKNRTRSPQNIVILAHDQVFKKFEDSAALRQFIKILKTKEDYEFEIVAHYPFAKKDSAVLK
jgi:peptidoglycan-N-acetylglucosamine deacetylase